MMDLMSLRTLAGWSALVHTAAGMISFTALMLFFMRGGFWGPVNDVFSILWALSLIPLAGWFFQASPMAGLFLRGVAALMGIAAMLLFAVLQLLLVLGQVRYEQTVGPVLILTGVIGLWLIINGWLARSALTFPPNLALVMLAAGAGLLFCMVGYFLGGEQHPLAAIGYVAGFIAGMVWAGWLSRYLLAGASLVLQ